MAFACAYLGR